ncbi:hypothetical protein VST7929_02409 [Vibrio stylophorae]|uniref:MSHA biogenesis protein MshN n=1 Tax=Vibrio stylophorae TaxID=659351 RepID=A0ABM8ZWU9_9VIBR|nr:tetratricopeptide repeat protein [Vibrio stylophorae]CAH0534476.1 hypothetical protein VST7929_02409 [Vibrio stylophorae]
MSQMNETLSQLAQKQGVASLTPAAVKPVRSPWWRYGLAAVGVVTLVGIGSFSLIQQSTPAHASTATITSTAAASSSNVQKPVNAADEHALTQKSVTPTVDFVAQATPVKTVTLASTSSAQSAKPSEHSAKTHTEHAPRHVAVAHKQKTTTEHSKPVASAQTKRAAAAKPFVANPTPSPRTQPVALAKVTAKTEPAVATDVKTPEGEMTLQVVERSPAELATLAEKQAQLALDKGDRKRAAAALTRALEYEPERVSARQQLAALYYGQRQAAQAVALLQQGIALMPQDTQLRLMLAKLLAREKQPAAALSVMQYLPGHAPIEYLAMRGALAQQLKANELAKQSYQLLTLRQPYDGRWWLGLAIAFERLGEPAVEAYRHAQQGSGLSLNSQQFIAKRLEALGQK